MYAGRRTSSTSREQIDLQATDEISLERTFTFQNEGALKAPSFDANLSYNRVCMAITISRYSDEDQRLLNRTS